MVTPFLGGEDVGHDLVERGQAKGDEFQLVNAAVKLDGAHLPELGIFKNL
mgnify:FL=1